jgi:hypothetical protein
LTPRNISIRFGTSFAGGCTTGFSGYSIGVRQRTVIFNGTTLSSTPVTAVLGCGGATAYNIDCQYTGASGSTLVFTFKTDDALSASLLNVGKTDLAAGTISNLTLSWTTSVLNDTIRFPVQFAGRNVTFSVSCSAGGSLIMSVGNEMVGG